eukprot:gnl/TRDRNA2_/TRDRNA2_179753_c0_seq1.p1 gnl/TRDRNA2_/TRDRNA2_179753_c0~~gnl/TRDRNA2_/TRDRNA2_179753_c0_seq1.p1  ORF type:complete len:484 (-),score=63.55 gnl/TRDRNA2_/TRDRNA2_179753_c0_seq1:79-1530(-)
MLSFAVKHVCALAVFFVTLKVDRVPLVAAEVNVPSKTEVDDDISLLQLKPSRSDSSEHLQSSFHASSRTSHEEVTEGSSDPWAAPDPSAAPGPSAAPDQTDQEPDHDAESYGLPRTMGMAVATGLNHVAHAASLAEESMSKWSPWGERQVVDIQDRKDPSSGLAFSQSFAGDGCANCTPWTPSTSTTPAPATNAATNAGAPSAASDTTGGASSYDASVDARPSRHYVDTSPVIVSHKDINKGQPVIVGKNTMAFAVGKSAIDGSVSIHVPFHLPHVDWRGFMDSLKDRLQKIAKAAKAVADAVAPPYSRSSSPSPPKEGGDVKAFSQVWFSMGNQQTSAGALIRWPSLARLKAKMKNIQQMTVGDIEKKEQTRFSLIMHAVKGLLTAVFGSLPSSCSSCSQAQNDSNSSQASQTNSSKVYQTPGPKAAEGSGGGGTAASGTTSGATSGAGSGAGSATSGWHYTSATGEWHYVNEDGSVASKVT